MPSRNANPGCLQRGGMVRLLSVLPMRLLAAIAFASVSLASEAARADCDRRAGNNVTAICKDTTINQGTSNPGFSSGTIGYRAAALTNLNVTVDRART